MGKLAGKKVLILRPEHQAADLARSVAERGGIPVRVPGIEILEPKNQAIVDDIISRSNSFDWIIFTSVNCVKAFLSIAGVHADETTKIAAIGPSTRKALEDNGMQVEWMPSQYSTSAIGSEFPAEPCRVLVVRAEGAPTGLEEILIDRGYEVERVNVYRSEPINAEKIAAALGDGVDAVALTSASIASSYAAAASSAGPRPPLFSIGPETTEASRGAGLEIEAEATEHTMEGVVEAMEKHFETRET